VRKAGGRVRIATQLIDALDGAHLWADHFDGSLEDVLGLQEDVAIKVAGIIEPALRAAETHGSAEHPIGNQFESAASDPFSAPSASRAERRQLTMMICDLAGLAAPISPLDPEDLYDHIAAHRRAARLARWWFGSPASGCICGVPSTMKARSSTAGGGEMAVVCRFRGFYRHGAHDLRPA
jgi:hypothetical protein